MQDNEETYPFPYPNPPHRHDDRAHSPHEPCSSTKDLIASYRGLRAFMNAASDHFALLDADLNYLDINKATLDFIGANRKDVVGKNILSVFHDAKEKGLYDRFQKVAETGRPFAVEEFVPHERFGQVCLSIRAFKVGEGIGIMVSDITERKRAEARLNESEQRYRTLVESAGETIATIDRSGVFLFMNGIGARRLGGKPEDYVGKTMWDLFPREIADRQMTDVRHVIDTGRGISVVTPTELKGELRWYNTTVEPLRDRTGKVTAALIIARDIHERRQVELELEAYRQKMARAERLASLGTLSATLAHELNQPLTVIALAIENSLAELQATPCPQTVVESLRDSLREVSNAASILERFRNFAKKSSQKTISKVDIKTVAERMLGFLKSSAAEARVALRTENMDDLPPVYSNEKDLEQLFFALVQNAIQAADGHEPRELVVGGSVSDGCVVLRFRDDCGGIDEPNVRRIFEPFFTTKASSGGTGLGLCIVERVAERSGGKVRLENRPGEGATFVVTLRINPRWIS